MITMILLAMVFLAVVVPQAVSARAQRQQEFLDSIQFHAGARSEGDTAAVASELAPRLRSVNARRKSIFVFLLVSMAVTAIPAVIAPTKMTLVTQLAVDNCFLAYVGLLVRWRDARAPARAPAPAPGLVLTPATAQPILRAG